MFDWKPCIEMIEDADSIAVLPHLSADGDAIGSAFSLAAVLAAEGKRVRVFLEEDPEERLLFLLPETVEYGIIGTPDCEVERQPEFDLAIAVDCADRNRLGCRAAIFFQARGRIKIDHHIERDPFGILNYTEPAWSATCEGIWQLLCCAPWRIQESLHEPAPGWIRSAALCLYSGIASDTGGFAYSNTTSLTHEIAAVLVGFLGDVSGIHFNLFERNTKESLCLFARAYGKIEYYFSGRMAVLVLNSDDFTISGAKYEDANELVSVLRGINGVSVAVFIRPSRNGSGIKVSLRSNGEADVSALAARHGGGGHRRAAGFDFTGAPEEILPVLTAEIEESLI